MIVTIHLHGGKSAYENSIAQLRNVLKVEGRKGYLLLDIVLEEGGEPQAQLLMSRTTLYIEGFKNSKGAWFYFSDTVRPVDRILGSGNVSPLRTKGTHSDLGTAGGILTYDSFTHMKLKMLTAYDGGSDELLKPALSFAAVSCSEAVRFGEVELAVRQLLTGVTQSYKPYHHWSTLLKNWQSLSKDNSAKVVVKYHAGDDTQTASKKKKK
jgi:hypothetical protein